MSKHKRSLNQFFLKPDWHAPNHVKAISTFAFPEQNFAQLDNPSFAHNTNVLIQRSKLPQAPSWLTQVHGNAVVELTPNIDSNFEADAAWTTTTDLVCVVRTADCVPLLLTDKQGSCVAAVHAGWKGLAKNIIAETVRRLPIKTCDLLVWIGPAISQAHYEVDTLVYDAFNESSKDYQQAFLGTKPGKWQCSLLEITKVQLKRLAIPNANIYGGNHCTFADSRFYSARRAHTARQAHLIWLNSQ